MSDDPTRWGQWPKSEVDARVEEYRKTERHRRMKELVGAILGLVLILAIAAAWAYFTYGKKS